MLRPDTQNLWDHLKSHAGLSQFILVGGTALALHLNHRISEDLDFMIPRARLPRRQIDLLKRECLDTGFEFVSNDSSAALLEFEDTGMDYADYQQDYIVEGSVKLTLVAPDPEVSILLNSGLVKGPRVASIEEIFRLKCIACANRSKSRDWLDMYILLTRNLFQPIDILHTFELAKVPQKFDIAMARMTRGKLDIDDVGYESLLEKPPNLSEMRAYFTEVFNTVQIEAAELAMQRHWQLKQ